MCACLWGEYAGRHYGRREYKTTSLGGFWGSRRGLYVRTKAESTERESGSPQGYAATQPPVLQLDKINENL